MFSKWLWKWQNSEALQCHRGSCRRQGGGAAYKVTVGLTRPTLAWPTAAVHCKHSRVRAIVVLLQKTCGQEAPRAPPPSLWPRGLRTHLLIDVSVNPPLALQPLFGDPAQLLLRALVALQQGAVRVLLAGVVCRGSQPRKRGLSTKERGPKVPGQQPEVCFCHLPFQCDKWDSTGLSTYASHWNRIWPKGEAQRS